MITSSSTPGLGMKANGSGNVVGRAITEYDASSGKNGVVVVYIEKGFNQAAVEADFEGLLTADSVNVNYEPGTLPVADENVGVKLNGKKYAAFNQEFVDNLMGALKNQQKQIDKLKTDVAALQGFTGINEPDPSTVATMDTDSSIGSIKSRLNKLESGIAAQNTKSLTTAVFNGGVVTGDVEFQGTATFAALSTFKGNTVFTGGASFDGDVAFNGNVTFNQDSAGLATIKKGTDRVEIRFSKTQLTTPIVTASAEDFVDGQYKVTNASKTGFTIVTSVIQSKDVKFNWTAVLKKQ
jgi:hypothetical protein